MAFKVGFHVLQVLHLVCSGSEFMKVNATDKDQPGQISSELRYSIHSQDPPTPSDLFFINPFTGGIQVAAAGLDREVCVCVCVGVCV